MLVLGPREERRQLQAHGLPFCDSARRCAALTESEAAKQVRGRWNPRVCAQATLHVQALQNAQCKHTCAKRLQASWSAAASALTSLIMFGRESSSCDQPEEQGIGDTLCPAFLFPDMHPRATCKASVSASWTLREA